MPNKSDAEIDIFITTAAYLFATYTRDAKEIADIMRSTERSIHRYAEYDRWGEVLNILKYKGKRSFRVVPTRDIAREEGEDLDKARDLFRAFTGKGHSDWKAAEATGEILGLETRRVLRWARRFGWRDNTKTQDGDERP